MLSSQRMHLLSISLLWIVSVAGENISITTDVGEFVGTLERKVEFNGNHLPAIRFLGIPFAKPPVGSLRFKRPEVPDAHLGDYNATYFRPHCAQTVSDLPYVANFKLDEDCLYLNVFIPGDRIINTGTIPVMIWIYGGAFSSGGADIYSGDILSAFNDVIVVTFNYRVNVFGFLSDGSKSSGNFGLWDQKMAIKWVHDNIETFGGDVNNVTLFGESAGGASVIYQSLHAGNKNMFQRVIAQSGTALAPWALQRHPSHSFRDFSDRIGCATGTRESTLQCLRGNTTLDLLSSVNSLNPFLPFVDGDFLADEPAVILTNQSTFTQESFEQFKRIDLLIGVNDKDGALIISQLWRAYTKNLPYRFDIADGVSKYAFDRFIIPKMLQSLLGIKDPLVTKATVHQYTDWTDEHDTVKVRTNMVDMSSDILFFVPAINTADRHSDSAGSTSTYFYEFSHKPWFSDQASQSSWIQGASHTMEIPYVFGLSDSFKVVANIPEHVQFYKPRDDISLSLLMMKMWTNFAKTGNPNSPSLSQQGYRNWPAYQSDNQPFFRFSDNITSHSIQHHLAAARFKFWTDLVPALQTTCSTSARVVTEPTSDAATLTHRVEQTLCSLVVLITHLINKYAL